MINRHEHSCGNSETVTYMETKLDFGNDVYTQVAQMILFNEVKMVIPIQTKDRYDYAVLEVKTEDIKVWKETLKSWKPHNRSRKELGVPYKADVRQILEVLVSQHWQEKWGEISQTGKKFKGKRYWKGKIEISKYIKEIRDEMMKLRSNNEDWKLQKGRVKMTQNSMGMGGQWDLREERLWEIKIKEVFF